jgi:hypothetical protein
VQNNRAVGGHRGMVCSMTEAKAPERTLFGHLIGLANLFGVKLWERFSFYGMLTILGYCQWFSAVLGCVNNGHP